MRKFIVGDIHGCYDELMELVEKIGLTDDDLLVSLGDIVDRGNKSKEVYEYFLNRPNSVVLMGNHERKHQNGVLSYAQEIVKVQLGNAYEGFLQWLNGLAYYYETGEALIIHAFFEHDQELTKQKQEVLSGSTAGDRYLEKKYPEGSSWTDFYTGVKPIIYGHRVVGDQPKVTNNTYGIDTGACHGNYLTAIELPGFIIHQVKAATDYWKEQQKTWQIPVLKAKNWQEMPFADIDKQLEKLAYIEDREIVNYLDGIRNWKNGLLDAYVPIKAQIDQFTKGLLEAHPGNFSQEANKHLFKTYLFKSRSNNLTIEDLQKGLNTPNKVTAIKKALNMG
ncbi:metallophosphoesterase [Niastella yeongjuensis]|uniref:Metallophosphoesterase n=1 Tax=Niastella yeongjuensis TaxID=354355 RepID=A0A1V9EV15_9BACT|nr:metallophosphoesterase [Niastella yeongjuensis]OQP49744.1 metallophosphoesterase [Niastella yeongjuensis]SEP40674.1 serine/threonine protein phosphatase 1 [Niastella yeongjuensis]